METFDIVKLASYRENNRIEAKAAKVHGGLMLRGLSYRN